MKKTYILLISFCNESRNLNLLLTIYVKFLSFVVKLKSWTYEKPRWIYICGRGSIKNHGTLNYKLNELM